MASDIKCRVFNSGEMRGRGNGLRWRRENEARKRRNGGVCETDPPREDRHPFVLKSNQQASCGPDKTRNKIPVVSDSESLQRGKRIDNYSTSSRIYTVDYEIKGDT